MHLETLSETWGGGDVMPYVDDLVAFDTGQLPVEILSERPLIRA